MFFSGGILFTSFAQSVYGNLHFRIKMSAPLVAGVNALVFHVKAERPIAMWDRVAGVTSIGVWAVAILVGRMISYTML